MTKTFTDKRLDSEKRQPHASISDFALRNRSAETPANIEDQQLTDEALDNEKKQLHASIPDFASRNRSAETLANKKDRRYRWSIVKVLLHLLAIIPAIFLIVIHQSKVVLIGALFASFLVLFLLALNKTKVQITPYVKKKRIQPYTIGLVLFIVFIFGILFAIGLPQYQDERKFYAAVASIEEQINSGDKGSVKELAYLYINKKRPIPHPYSYVGVRTKGASLLEQWLLEEISRGNAILVNEDMYNLAKAVAWFDKERARKWFLRAHENGHATAMKQLLNLDDKFKNKKTQELLADNNSNNSNTEPSGRTTIPINVSSAELNPSSFLKNVEKTNVATQKVPRETLRVTTNPKQHQINFTNSLDLHPEKTEIEARNARAIGQGGQIFPKIHEVLPESIRYKPEDANTTLSPSTRWMYSQGNNQSMGEKKNIEWYIRAAGGGDLAAQSNLGWMYLKGIGIPQSYKDAIKWFRKAAEQGDPAAQSNLGWMYDVGKGVAEDSTQAVIWYRKAAEQGYAAAQSNLAAMYGNGRGIAQNNVLAYMWSNLSAIQGHDYGKKNRGNIAVKLSERQIAEAQRLTQEWLDKHKQAP